VNCRKEMLYGHCTESYKNYGRTSKSNRGDEFRLVGYIINKQRRSLSPEIVNVPDCLRDCVKNPYQRYLVARAVEWWKTVLMAD